MSNLAVQVQVAGAAGTGLTASVWPAGSFWAPPPGRGTIVPATSPTATGTTDGSGDVTLTGLSSVNYWLVVVDARSVTNWFFVSAPYVGGGTYQANIPWSTPTSVTSPVDVRGGDTLGPNGNTSKGPWCPLLHVHEIPAASPAGQTWPSAFNQMVPGHFVANPLNDTWYANDLAVVGSEKLPIFVMLSFNPDSATAGAYGGVIVYGSDDGGVTPIQLASNYDTVEATGLGFQFTFSFIVPIGSSFKWHNAYVTGTDRTAMDLAEATYYY